MTLLASSACTGRSHPLREGPYAFVAQEVLRDDCGLLASKDALWGGELVITGNEVAMAYGLFDIRMVGLFLESLESFTMDGSANGVQLTLASGACVADLLTVHLDGETVDPTHFQGALKISVQGTAPCSCVLSTTYQATSP
jgi:hypothetical protein